MILNLGCLRLLFSGTPEAAASLEYDGSIVIDEEVLDKDGSSICLFSL